jgi:hypothetical protein
MEAKLVRLAFAENSSTWTACLRMPFNYRRFAN